MVKSQHFKVNLEADTNDVNDHQKDDEPIGCMLFEAAVVLLSPVCLYKPIQRCALIADVFHYKHSDYKVFFC